MPDRYTYPGSHVLANLHGYHDPELWKAAERRTVNTHLAELVEHPVVGAFDLPHLQAIHARLVRGFYSWVGQLRTTDTGPGGTGIAHCRPEFVVAEATRIFTVLAEMDRLRGRDRDGFSRDLAWVWGEITVVHPFRDVNTRSQFAFFNQLAAEAGWLIDWSRIDPYVFGHARTVAIFADERGLDALLYPALERLGDTTHADLAQTTQEGAQRFGRPGELRTRAELDRELQAAIDRRRSG